MAQATVHEVLERLHDRWVREVADAHRAPADRVRRMLHAYAAEKLLCCLEDVLALLPPEEAREWIALRRAAVDASVPVGGGSRGC